MRGQIKQVGRFLREEDGVTAIEYGLLGALIAVAIIVGATFMGSSLNTQYTTVASAVGSVMP